MTWTECYSSGTEPGRDPRSSILLATSFALPQTQGPGSLRFDSNPFLPSRITSQVTWCGLSHGGTQHEASYGFPFAIVLYVHTEIIRTLQRDTYQLSLQVAFLGGKVLSNDIYVYKRFFWNDYRINDLVQSRKIFMSLKLAFDSRYEFMKQGSANP